MSLHGRRSRNCWRQQGTAWNCATVVVISHRAPLPKLLKQLPVILDTLTQMELRKEDVAVQVAAAGVPAACLWRCNIGGLSGGSWTLTEALSLQGRASGEGEQTADHQGVQTGDQQGLHRDFEEGSAWAPQSKGWKTKDYTWTRTEWRLPWWGRPEVCDFWQEKEGSFLACRSAFPGHV